MAIGKARVQNHCPSTEKLIYHKYDISTTKEQGVNISLATIYRTLDKLCSEGIARKMTMGDGAGSCYQYVQESDCHSHFHLKCIECGKLIHLSCDFLANMEKHIHKEHGFTISAGKTVIYGKCSDCEALKK